VWPEADHQWQAFVRVLVHYGVSFSAKNLTVVTLLLTSLLLMVAFGISTIVRELELVRYALEGRRGPRAKAE